MNEKFNQQLNKSNQESISAISKISFAVGLVSAIIGIAIMPFLAATGISMVIIF